MQPINEETWRQMQTIGLNALPPGNPPTDAPPVMPPINTAPPIGPAASSHSVKLQEFIQNEQNGHLFYKHLSSIAPRQEYSKMLDGISECCIRRKNAFHNIYHGLENSDFQPRESEINNKVQFHEGVRLAVREESEAIRALTDLYDEIQDDRVAKTLNSQMYRKVSDLSLLHSMLA